ncbi:PREDICTED: putative HVA22-like protein g isoform X1 [Ipomoea nil]|uniref:putative HVA22-like protein g isoform X1 n=1 Tax=Ipomoea nil TaxID=35883 RepID=UPI000901F7BC|nr:PREDICTED: putative HVA22-like protein g isoform X1 [Ipomoea nil]
MLGEFITSSLVLILGYAYPALECFKSVEKNRVDIAELRFWCQYWIIVALVRVLESIGDLSVSWMPMYTEAKLALFIYLWHPKTKGTTYIYEALLRPFVARHEGDIDRRFWEFRAKAWDLAIYYWHNCTELGQAKILDMVELMASPSRKGTQKSSEKKDKHNRHSSAPPPPSPPPPPSSSSGFFKKKSSDKRRTSPPPSPFSTYRSISQPTKSNLVEVQLPDQTQVVYSGENYIVDSESVSSYEDRSRGWISRFSRSRGRG